MSGVGERLREQRIKLGLTLEEVEEQTKIRRFYIEAIENEDYKSLPGKVYIIGFLRSYCKILNINPKDIIDEFNASWPDTDNVANYVKEATLREKKAPKINFNYNKLLRFSIIVLAIVVLLGVNKLWNKPTPVPPPQDPIINQPNNNEEEMLGETENDTNLEQEPIYIGVNLEIIPVRGDCWLEVSIDNQTVYSGILRQGEEKLVFQSETEIHVRFGNAGAVDIVLNGELLDPIGNMGEVVRKTFTLEE